MIFWVEILGRVQLSLELIAPQRASLPGRRNPPTHLGHGPENDETPRANPNQLKYIGRSSWWFQPL